MYLFDIMVETRVSKSPNLFSENNISFFCAQVSDCSYKVAKSRKAWIPYGPVVCGYICSKNVTANITSKCTCNLNELCFECVYIL